MTDVELHEDLPPVAHVTIVYTGPIAPHWELRVRYGDQKFLDDFWARVNARLLLLPKHDPQFRRNKERVNRDAERERITCDWDLGEDDADTTITPLADTAPPEARHDAPAAPAAETAQAADVATADEPVGDESATSADAAGAVDDAADAAAEAAEPVAQASGDAAAEVATAEQPAEL